MTRVKEVEGIEESLALVVANGCRRAADGATVAWHRRADELGMKAAAAGRVSLCRPCLSILCLGSCDDRRPTAAGATVARLPFRHRNNLIIAVEATIRAKIV